MDCVLENAAVDEAEVQDLGLVVDQEALDQDDGDAAVGSEPDVDAES